VCFFFSCAQVVELSPGPWLDRDVFPKMARVADHLNVAIDLRPDGGDGAQVRLTQPFTERIVAEVMTQWSRHHPCTREEESSRATWHDKKRPFTERFPMADSKGDRAKRINYANTLD